MKIRNHRPIPSLSSHPFLRFIYCEKRIERNIIIIITATSRMMMTRIYYPFQILGRVTLRMWRIILHIGSSWGPSPIKCLIHCSTVHNWVTIPMRWAIRSNPWVALYHNALSRWYQVPFLIPPPLLVPVIIPKTAFCNQKTTFPIGRKQAYINRYNGLDVQSCTIRWLYGTFLAQSQHAP